MSGQGANRGSFQPGRSGNPGGRPPSAEISALARRYTADWMTALVEVVRLPRVTKNLSGIVAAARELREVGYPGLSKASPEAPAGNLHLHLLAVTQEAQNVLRGLPGGGVSAPTLDGEAWDESETGQSVDSRTVPPPDSRLPHEALPLWDAAPEQPMEENNGGAEATREGREEPDAPRG